MDWRVPLSDLNFGAEERNAILSVLDSGWLTMGEVTSRFEDAFASMLDIRHAIGVSNATVGLHLACLALDIGPGDEVITPSLSFVATANSVKYVGAKPVFADVSSLMDFSISPSEIMGLITPATKAILVMHYGGYLCDMSSIMEIAQKKNLAVIEDAAHAPGAELLERKAGTWGDIGVFSFFSNKNLATGEGGMVVTNRDDIAEKIRRMRSHGMTTLTLDRYKGHAFSYDVVELGYNYRIDEIRSSLGLVQLEKLERSNQRRREISDYYREKLANLEGISIPYQDHLGITSAHLFPILLENGLDRTAFMQSMKDDRIQTSVHYPPIHQFTYYREQVGEMRLPVTEEVGAREVTLPLFPSISEEQVKLVVDGVKKAVDDSSS